MTSTIQTNFAVNGVGAQLIVKIKKMKHAREKLCSDH